VWLLPSETLTSSVPTSQEWRLTDAIIVGLVLVGGLVIGLWIAPESGTIASKWPHATYFQRSQTQLLVALAVQFGAVATVVLAICKLRGIHDPLSSIGWNLNRNVGLSAVAGLGAAAGVSFALTLGFGGVVRFGDGFAPASILLYFVTTVLVQPFVEECYFRGILFAAVRKRVGQFGTVALTSLLFGVFHVGGYRLILLFMALGVLLGITRIKTRSVAACFSLHAAYNVGILISRVVQTRQ
jgi:membrane protease YdiL (CAAX protease family)